MRLVVIALIIASGLLALRLALPGLVLDYVNQRLAMLEGYEGRIDDVDLLLLAGRYSITGIKLERTTGDIPVPFIRAERVVLQMRWRALLHGRLEGTIRLDGPELNIVDGPTEGARQTGTETSWNELVDSLFPFVLNELTIRDGSFHFRNFSSTPEVDLQWSGIQLTVTNLRNRAISQNQRSAHFNGTALLEGQVPLSFYGSYEWLSTQPDFDFHLQMEAMPVSMLDDLLRAYLNVDATGELTLTMEVTARNGVLNGYVQPLLKDLNILDWQKDVAEHQDSPLKVAWQGLLDFVTTLFENQPASQFGSRIPIHGPLQDMQVGSFSAAISMLYNAFIEALKPGYDDEVEVPASD